MIEFIKINEQRQMTESNIIKSKRRRMNKNNSTVAIYPSHTIAEAAIKKLQQSGFDMKRLSVVGRDYPTGEHVVGCYYAGDHMKAFGKTGDFWGGAWGLLFGSAFFWVPELGPLLVAGPLVNWIVGATTGDVLACGLSPIGAGLHSLGIPKDSILKYEAALKTDKFVLIAHGSLDDITQAKKILSHTDPELLERQCQDRFSVSSMEYWKSPAWWSV
jgi:hypothetical protein